MSKSGPIHLKRDTSFTGKKTLCGLSANDFNLTVVDNREYVTCRRCRRFSQQPTPVIEGLSRSASNNLRSKARHRAATKLCERFPDEFNQILKEELERIATEERRRR